jgi:hypothetical protein
LIWPHVFLFDSKNMFFYFIQKTKRPKGLVLSWHSLNWSWGLLATRPRWTLTSVTLKSRYYFVMYPPF